MSKNIIETNGSPAAERSVNQHIGEIYRPWTLYFNYLGKQFHIIHDISGISRRSFPIDAGYYPESRLDIYNQYYELVGLIDGRFNKESQSEIIFKIIAVANTKREYLLPEKLIYPGYVPGIVRESIIQLLISNKVDQYVTTDVILDLGKKMFDRMQADPRVKTEFNAGCYIITKH